MRRLFGLFVALSLGGCNAILGTDEYATASGAAARPQYAEPDCAHCVADACGALEQACLADHFGTDNCALVDRCIAQCAPDDVACRGQCLMSHPNGRQSFVGLDECRHTECAPACIGTRGFGTLLGAECDQCLSGTCSTESASCAGEWQCDWSMSCLAVQQPVDPDNVMRCAYDVAGDLTTNASTLWISCMQQCSQCATGTHWDCAGQFHYPSSYRGGDLPYRARVNSFADTTSTDGVAVDACNAFACRGPFYAQDGFVDVELPMVETGVFPVDGYFRFSADAFVPSIQYLGRPITRSERNEGFDLVSKTVELYVTAGFTTPVDVTNQGLVVFRPEDCLRHDAQDVELDGVTGWTELQGIQTFRAFANVPPGSHTVHMQRASTGEVLGSLTVRVEPGTVTGAALLPDPE